MTTRTMCGVGLMGMLFFSGAAIAEATETSELQYHKEYDNRWEYLDGVSHWVLGDEIRTLSVMGLDSRELNQSFRDYLKQVGAGALYWAFAAP